ncbi:DNA replication/repair protein RecF [Asticcacaulis excentricus]|uniref:DNA replication and repair protein RecF n=1 Tax=Asticcacaulis excentricus TaxID=78587 RepID=A0A3G9G857_9CAUL|nr:DNA replication/repair protein RecF [Asticcacaulis excentricus]BBF81284.1 DNA recombination and repair protein RecF [Asticcacaulis excentricus]
MKTRIHALSLTDFRGYDRLDVDLAGRSLYLFGPNGAGKTNFLEAISVLNPGRGLRGAAVSDLGRRLPQEAKGRAWGVSVELKSAEDDIRIGTGSDPRSLEKRLVRIDQQTVPAGRLLDHIRLVWLTPAQDRIFLEARAERLRFFDRLVFAATPSHATTVSAYEKALRERLKLLVQGPADAVWLDALEERLAEAGSEMIVARRAALSDLQAEIEAHESAFPKADLGLISEASDARDPDALNSALREGFARARARDSAAGRSLFGPHRTDLSVFHREKDRPAADCSTGEQKALVLNLILAQGSRLSRVKSAPNPVVLLDEVAAHLDPIRRAALFDETDRLGLQTLFTGTDESLFDGLSGRALGVRVEGGQWVEFRD